MPRFLHGASITLDEIRNTPDGQGRPLVKFAKALLRARTGDEKNFDFLFPRVQQDPANLLPTGPQTTKQLVNLGIAMNDDQDDAAGDSNIPAAYTYFGQFVDHDITLETKSATLPTLLDPNMQPMSLDEIRTSIQNLRTATLDLDSVYGPPDQPALRDVHNQAKLQVGTVARLNNPAVPFGRPAGKDDHNDLPRQARSTDVETDRAALIGDPRNDENTIVAQLHVAFLRAHNAIVDQGHTFEDAQRLLRQHYQHLVLHDFLPRIADPAIVQDILANGNNVYRPLPNRFFLPLEYAVAAYRFGHSMVRGVYNFNVNFNTHGDPAVGATLDLLFTFTAISGQLGFPSNPANPHESGSDTLPENWIIEWERFVEGSALSNHARRINTQLVEPLERLTDELGHVVGGLDANGKPGLGANLAVRNLLRGYRLRMPTGQAVARALERPRLGNLRGLDIPVLTPQQIEAGAANGNQVTALRNGGFLERTPLWYYILAEAQVFGNGQHLGPVGSTIVAEVIIGLARRSSHSILDQRGWTPSLPSAQPGTFTLADLLRFAGVLGSQERAVGASG